MSKIFTGLILFLVASHFAYAKQYTSAYGFTIDVPAHWLVLTPAELKANPDLFNFDKVDFGKLDKNLLKQVLAKIESGNIEIYFNQKTADTSFADNINILKQIGKVPVEPADVKIQCAELGGQLSQYFGHKVNVYQCKVITFNKQAFFMSEFDGAMAGTRSIQYQFNVSPSVAIIMTATSKDKTTDVIRTEFDAMIKSVKLK